MIHILYLILKIIGITILVVLGLILLVLALVLFVPVFYRVRIIHNPQQTKVTAMVSFLWPAVTAAVQYFKKLTYRVKIFGISILDSEKTKQEKTKKVKFQKQKNKKEKQENFLVPLEKPDSMPQENREEIKTSAVQQWSKEPADNPESPKKNNKKPGLFSKIKAKIKKIRETIRKIFAKIKKLVHQKDEVLRILEKQETKTALRFVWGKLGRLLKHIFPRKLKGYVAYGAGNPATTGQVLGILSVIYARTGQILEIRPNFEEKQLESDMIISGRIQLFTLLVIVVKVILHKELRQVMKEFKGIKDIE